MKNTLLLITLLVLLSACNAAHREDKSVAQHQPNKPSDEFLIKETVLTDLGLSPEGTLGHQDVIRILLVPKEEKEYFTTRYSTLAPIVKVRAKGSEESEGTVMVGGVLTDKESGRRAMTFTVSLDTLVGSEAKAYGGIFYGNTGGSTSVYTLRLESGKWRILKKDPYISF